MNFGKKTKLDFKAMKKYEMKRTYFRCQFKYTVYQYKN